MITPILIPCQGYAIAADWHEGTDPHTTILMLVGFGSNKHNNRDFVSRVTHNTGFNALVVDFSGHGESPFNIDNISPAQHILEAVAAYDWIIENHSNQSIITMGTSYGGFIAAQLSKYRAVAKLVLRTPAIYEPASLYTPHHLIDKIHARKYRSNAEMLRRHPLLLTSDSDTPKALVVIHSEDESIPAQTTDAYVAAFNADAYVAEGFVHSFRSDKNPSEGIESYYQHLKTWLRDT